MFKLLDKLFRGRDTDLAAAHYNAGFRDGSKCGYSDGYIDGFQAGRERGHIRRPRQKSSTDPERTETLYKAPKDWGRYVAQYQADIAAQSAAAYGDPWTKD